MTWVLAGTTVWASALIVVMSVCAAGARSDRANAVHDARRLRLVPQPSGAGASAPALLVREARRLGDGLHALGELVGAAHIAVTLWPSEEEVVAAAGDTDADADAPAVVAPLFGDGQRIATLTARRRPGAAPFSPRQVETVYASAVLLGAMLHADAVGRADGGRRSDLQSVRS